MEVFKYYIKLKYLVIYIFKWYFILYGLNFNIFLFCDVFSFVLIVVIFFFGVLIVIVVCINCVYKEDIYFFFRRLKFF